MTAAEQVPERALAFLGRKYGLDEENTRAMVRRTGEILCIDSTNAVTFMVSTILNPSQVTICDGCKVRKPFEHRCHGSRSMVRGEQSGKPCQCLEGFEITADELP